MKSLPSIVAALILIVVLLTYMCTFQVRSTEVAIIKTFGQADPTPIEVDEHDRSFFGGLHLKWPWPIESVEKYDKRLRLLEDRIEETPTLDDKQIILTTYTTWTIADPFKFHTRYTTIADGEKALRDRVRSYKKAIIGQHNFSAFVSTHAESRQLGQIEEEMRDAVAKQSLEDFGIAVKRFGIRQISLPESVTKAVFEAMKSEQKVRAQKYRAEGTAEGDRIRAEAEAAANRIHAVVQRKVDAIESRGLAEVGRIYASFAGHEELRIFLDELHALEQILKTRTEIFMDTNFPPMNLWDPQKRILSGAPSLDKAQGSPAAVGGGN